MKVVGAKVSGIAESGKALVLPRQVTGRRNKNMALE